MELLLFFVIAFLSIAVHLVLRDGGASSLASSRQTHWDDVNADGGSTANSSALSEWIGSASRRGSHCDDGGPMVNIDGTPMMGSIDLNGNVFGVTDH